MKTKFTIIVLLTFIITPFLLSQSNDSDSASINPIKDISFMIGEWQGEGWIMKGREKSEFTQYETIKPKLDSTILVIDGLGYSKDSLPENRKIIHSAFGVISFDNTTQKMEMLSYSTAKGKMVNEFRKTGDKKLEWSFKDERGGTIRFQEDFSSPGIWKENGDYSFDGEKWFPFFQMELKRVE